MKQKPKSATEFIYNHRVGLLSTALVVSTTLAVGFRFGLRDHDRFLRREGLYEKYYNIEK